MAGIISRREGGGARSPGLFPAAARGGGSPEFTENSVPGVKLARVWVWEVQHGMGNPPGPRAGHDEALGSAGKGSGGSARRGSPAQAVRGAFVLV